MPSGEMILMSRKIGIVLFEPSERMQPLLKPDRLCRRPLVKAGRQGSKGSAFIGWLVLAFGLSAACAGCASAQGTKQVSEPAFEAASIRPSRLEPGCYSLLPPGGTHFTMTCVTLRDLIGQAWGLRGSDVEGGDAAALNTYYDVRAVTPEGQPWTLDSVQPMLHRLMIERFHVVAYPGTKQISGYLLVVAKGGAKLERSAVDVSQEGQAAGRPFQSYIYPGYVHTPGASLEVIASLLASAAREPVANQTGLAGTYKVDLHFATDGNSESNYPDLFTAIQEQLGLKLQAGKLTVKTLIITHVDESPTEN